MPRKAALALYDPADTRPASMRPRLLCPGKRAYRLRRPWHRAGFNEAEAVMPRKACAAASWGSRDSSSFNEAEAVMPRKASRLVGERRLRARLQ